MSVDQVVDIEHVPLEQQLLKISISPFPIQEMFIENAILASSIGKESPLSTMIKETYASSITSDHAFVYSLFLPNRPRKFNMKTKVWSNSQSSVSATPQRELVHSDKGIYGMYKKDVFSIVDLRGVSVGEKEKEATKRGQACSSYKTPNLLDIIVLLRIPPLDHHAITLEKAIHMVEKDGLQKEGMSNDDIVLLAYWSTKPKKILCSAIESWLAEHKLVKH
jgi:hypothetical protein